MPRFTIWYTKFCVRYVFLLILLVIIVKYYTSLIYYSSALVGPSLAKALLLFGIEQYQCDFIYKCTVWNCLRQVFSLNLALGFWRESLVVLWKMSETFNIDGQVLGALRRWMVKRVTAGKRYLRRSGLMDGTSSTWCFVEDSWDQFWATWRDDF